ncbi:FRG domain-containing protein [Ruegeria sp. SCP11]|uniref:FRG domain-containing protein n=1 Tax=Ruegeria sp. SCP11 TaxID=3141378 RepID=UPI0033386296
MKENRVDTERFGEIRAPVCFEELVSSICELDNDAYYSSRFWRGQAKAEWPIETTSFRRAKNSIRPTRETLNDLAIKSDESMLKRARHSGFGFSNGRELNDWELITKLRHYGASTCLLDVSKNPLVGLWFACSSEQESPGILFGLLCNEIHGIEKEHFRADYTAELFNAKNHNFPMLYDPSTVSPRVAAQSSCFLFGSASDNPMGSMVYDGTRDGQCFYYISPELKVECLKKLDQVFCINRLSLFPDIEGFSQANACEYDMSSDYRW